jgi:hypothetical protein
MYDFYMTSVGMISERESIVAYERRDDQSRAR